MLRLAGGPEAVTAYVRGLGVPDMRIDRPEVQMAADLYGVALPDPANWTDARRERTIAEIARAAYDYWSR